MMYYAYMPHILNICASYMGFGETTFGEPTFGETPGNLTRRSPLTPSSRAGSVKAATIAYVHV